MLRLNAETSLESKRRERFNVVPVEGEFVAECSAPASGRNRCEWRGPGRNHVFTQEGVLTITKQSSHTECSLSTLTHHVMGFTIPESSCKLIVFYDISHTCASALPVYFSIYSLGIKGCVKEVFPLYANLFRVKGARVNVLRLYSVICCKGKKCD